MNKRTSFRGTNIFYLSMGLILMKLCTNIKEGVNNEFSIKLMLKKWS